MNASKFDIIVIGSGPGGEGAAMQAAKAGKKVAIIEQNLQVGGGCTHSGTIPSKVLRQSIQEYKDIKANPLFKNITHNLDITYPQLLKRTEIVINKQVDMRNSFYERNHVKIIHGKAVFKDSHSVRIEQTKGEKIAAYSADYFVLAVGTSPYRPENVDFSHPRILDSNTILELDQTPSSITIYGAGVIGCEYASIFCNLGIRVNLINTRDKLLSFMDDEITDALSYHLRDQGVTIRHNELIKKIETTEDRVDLYLKSGKKIGTDYLLWANGRTGNTEGLGLDEIGIKPNSRSQININENYQTDIPYIYAVGDVVGFPGLASASFDQGRFAATHIENSQGSNKLIKNFPTGIYTSPEISSIGKTEKELTDAEIPYEIGHSMFRSLARAQIVGVDVGILKILFHRDTLELLGIHCFGYQAAEIIHIGQLVMAREGKDNTLMTFVNTTFNYPTMAEAYRVAALNGLNRLKY